MSSDEEEDVAPQKGMSKSLGLRFQKKLLGMSVKSKGAAKNFIDDTSGELLDNFYDLAQRYTDDTKRAKKLIKDLIKIAVKVGLLYRHNQFDEKELGIGLTFRKKFKMAALTMISYHQVAFTYDESFLTDILDEIRRLLHSQVARHLTSKSKGRIDNVFGFFAKGEVLTALYTNEKFKDLLDNIIRCLNQMSEEDKL
eukprot:m.109581 g.109581  ORF g.109581 m.109581 type:complete len:197 (-) comp22690_c0_seq1:100-690(-)